MGVSKSGKTNNHKRTLSLSLIDGFGKDTRHCSSVVGLGVQSGREVKNVILLVYNHPYKGDRTLLSSRLHHDGKLMCLVGLDYVSLLCTHCPARCDLIYGRLIML